MLSPCLAWHAASLRGPLEPIFVEKSRTLEFLSIFMKVSAERFQLGGMQSLHERPDSARVNRDATTNLIRAVTAICAGQKRRLSSV